MVNIALQKAMTPGPKNIPATCAELMDIVWRIAARNRLGPLGQSDSTTLRNIAPLLQPIILAAMPQIKEAFGVPVAERIKDEVDAGLAEDRDFEDPLLVNLKPVPPVSLKSARDKRGDSVKHNTLPKEKPPTRMLDLSEMLEKE